MLLRTLGDNPGSTSVGLVVGFLGEKKTNIVDKHRKRKLGHLIDGFGVRRSPSAIFLGGFGTSFFFKETIILAFQGLNWSKSSRPGFRETTVDRIIFHYL